MSYWNEGKLCYFNPTVNKQLHESNGNQKNIKETKRPNNKSRMKKLRKRENAKGLCDKHNVF
jgi:hypothetical protein